MRRIRQPLINIFSAVLLIGALYWGAPTLLDFGEYSSMPSRVVESLSAVGLSVEHVTVVGRINTDPADILDALGAVRGTPILNIDVPQSQHRIAVLPWVRSAEIIRRLPNSLHITLEEHVAFALWQHDGRYSLIARDGAMIGDVTDAPSEVSVLVGADAPAHAARLFEALSSQPHLTARVKAAVRYGSRRWDVILDAVEDGITIKLPEIDVSAAWDGLSELDAKHNFLGRAIAEIDLRIAGRLVVKLQDGYAPLPPKTKNTPAAQENSRNVGSTFEKELTEGV